MALVKKRLDARNERYVASATIQTFAKGVPMEKMAKGFGNQGFSTLIIVHDPTKSDDDSDLTYEGLIVTEANVDQFIIDNKVDAKEAKTPKGKLAIVKKWIDAKTSKK